MDLTKQNTLKKIVEKLHTIKPRENILLKVGQTYSLIKYESFDTEVENHNIHRYGRNMSIRTSNYLIAKMEDDEEKLLEIKAKQKAEHKRHKCNVYGTHCIDFQFDKEFELFLPSSFRNDKFLTIAYETSDGEIYTKEGSEVEVIVGDNLIKEILTEVVRPQYFEKVIIPFLKGRCTEFNVPEWKERLFRKTTKSWILNKFEKATKNLDHGSFVYVGSKEEVYLLSLARDESGNLYMQGTYTTSTKPLFYFSNNYLGFISKHDAEKPKFNGNGMCNVAVYRTFDIPGFHGEPFVFPQMGRSQDCKNAIFTGEPEIITGDITKALEHFAETDFAEFADIVKIYMSQIDYLHPSSERPNGKFYY